MPIYTKEQIQATIEAIYNAARENSVTTSMVASVLDNLFQRLDKNEGDIAELDEAKADANLLVDKVDYYSYHAFQGYIHTILDSIPSTFAAYADFGSIVGTFKIASGLTMASDDGESDSPNRAQIIGPGSNEMLSHVVHDESVPSSTPYSIVFLSSSKRFVAKPKMTNNIYYLHWPSETLYNLIDNNSGDTRARQNCIFFCNGRIFTFDGEYIVQKSLNRADIHQIVRDEIEAALQNQNNE